MTRRANPDLPKQILNEAEKIVIESGHENINMRNLAKRSGVTATAIYHYFANKEALLRGLKLQSVEYLNRRIRAIEDDAKPMDTLHRIGEVYIAFAEENPQLYRLIFESPIGNLGSGDLDILYYTYRAARRCLEKASASGKFRMDPRYGAMMGWIMLHGFSALLLSGNLQLAEGMDRDELRRIFLGFYAGGHL